MSSKWQTSTLYNRKKKSHIYMQHRVYWLKGTPVAQWVKRWPTNLAAPSSSPAQGKNPGLPLIIHFKIPWLFPDFSLTFYSFPYPLTDKKKLFLFFTLRVLTASLQNWALLLKERICFLEFAPQGSKFFALRVPPNETGDGLGLSHETVLFFPSWTE